jgi:hypothetical protein
MQREGDVRAVKKLRKHTFVAIVRPRALFGVPVFLCVVALGGACSGSNLPPENYDAGYDAETCIGSGTGSDSGKGTGTLPQASTPTFAPPAGNIPAGTHVAITSANLPSNGHIFYTTNGSLPNTTSSKVYTAGTTGIEVIASETIKAIAYAVGAYSPSSIATAIYVVRGSGCSDAGMEAAKGGDAGENELGDDGSSDGNQDVTTEGDSGDGAVQDSGASLGAPTVVTTVTAGGAVVAQSGISPNFAVNAQNAPLTSAITVAPDSPAGTYLCASFSDTTPTCSNGAASGCVSGSDTHLASGGTVSISTDGSVLYAVACAVASPLVQSAVVTVTYSLHVTPVVFGSAVSTCGDTTTVGFETSASALSNDAAHGGPTMGATICYGESPYNCIGTIPLDVSCFTTSSGNYSQSATVITATLYATSCPPPGLVGQNGNASPSTAIAQTEPGVSAYSNTITIGASFPGNWGASNELASSTSPIAGGFSHDGTNLYFEANQFTPASDTDVVIFLSDGAGTAENSMTTAPPALSPNAGATKLPFAAELAIDYETTSATVRQIYSNNHLAWSIVASTDSVYGSGFGGTNLYGDLITTGGANYQVVNGNALQTLVPLALIPSNTSGIVYVAGEVVSGIGGSPTVVAQWPLDGDIWGYVADSLTSCQTPVSSIQ